MSSELPEKKSTSGAASASLDFFPSPAPSSKPKFEHSTIKKHILKRFKKGEYKELREDITRYSLQEKEFIEFFSKAGYQFLYWALIVVTDDKLLKFWIETMPIQVLEILSTDNYSLFRSFLDVQIGLEEHGWYDSDTEKNQIEKFKTLLQLDTNTFVNFMQENAADQSIISDQIQTNFEDALNQHIEENPAPKP